MRCHRAPVPRENRAPYRTTISVSCGLPLVVRFGHKAASKSVVTLPPHKDKRVVVAVHRPRAGRHLAEFAESPVTRIFVPQSKIIPHSRRHIQACTLIQIWSWTFVAKYILPVIGPERAAIFPRGVTDFVTVTDSEPSAFENSLAFTYKRLLKLGNHLAGFRFCATAFDIVVR
jgi:hypothetical protein